LYGSNGMALISSQPQRETATLGRRAAKHPSNSRRHELVPLIDARQT